MTDQSGNFVLFRDYFPFGEPILADTTFKRGLLEQSSAYNQDTPFNQQFTANERDTESGMDYFGARYFSASLGRFTSADAPFADQYASSPQSWNLYGYVRNNPLRFIDPSGSACVVRKDGSTFDDDNGGQSCAEVDADPVGGEVTKTSGTVPLTDLPGQFFVGFGEFFLNGQLQGAAVMANALAVGAGLEFVFLATSSTNLAVVAASQAGDDFVRLLATLRKAAQQADRSGLTRAGRALQKHGSRPGSVFPQVAGSRLNQEAQKIVNNILTNPTATYTTRQTKNFGNVLEVRIPGAQGLRFTADGKKLIGFLEP